jgi:hypothetical protein
MSDNDLIAMNTKFPLLMDYSVMFIKNTPPANLLKMEGHNHQDEGEAVT